MKKNYLKLHNLLKNGNFQKRSCKELEKVCSLTIYVKCKSEIVKGTKVGPAFFFLVILYCLKAADEAHLPPTGNLGDHHNTLQ